MRSRRTIRATLGQRPLAVAAAGLAVVVAVPVALAAGSQPLERLRAEQQELGAAADSATLELYALEARLARARAEAQALTARRGELARQRAATHRRAVIAGRAEQAAQERLAELLRAQYAQSTAEPLEVLLAAGSLDEALSGLESLDRAAADSARVARRAAATRARLARLETRLTRQEAELATVVARARASVLELEAGAAQRAAYVARLRARAAVTERRLATMRAQAEAAAQRTATLQRPALLQAAAAADAAPGQPEAVAAAPAAVGPRTMRVDAVGYSLAGVTATGLPVGHGVVAVDPAVIPLGTRLHVPGYGDAVAADTGGAIRGALIDLWFPTVAQARAWGRRSVVVTFR